MSSIKFKDFLRLLDKAEEGTRYIKGVCPFHDDDNPSLLVFADGWFKCLGCNRYGRWQTLYNRLKGQPVQVKPEIRTSWSLPHVRPEQLEDVSYQAHLDLEHFPSLAWYLEMRGIDGRIEANELGYWEGWYTIPVRTREGVFDTAVFRAAPHVQEASGGFRYWSPHVPTLFVPDWTLFDNSKYVIVVYGMFDALLLAQMRFPVCTSTGGKDSFDSEWLDDTRKKIYIIPDLGEELLIRRTGNRKEIGTGAPYRLAAELGWRGEVVLLDYPDDAKDVNDFFVKGKAESLIAQLGEL